MRILLVRLLAAAALLAVFGPPPARSQPVWQPLPNRVVGQGNLLQTQPNFVDGRGLHRAQAVAVDTSVEPNRIYVLDVLNQRVLGWRDRAGLSHGAPADLVLGQPDFHSTGCNTGGISARSLCLEILGVFYSALTVDAAGNLFVADIDNHRVLEYDSPFTTDTVADRVFGQRDFTSRNCAFLPGGGLQSDNPCQPVGLAVDRAGTLYVSDNALGIFAYDQALTTDTVPDAKIGRQECEAIGADTVCLQEAIAVDGAGNLYVAEPFLDRVTVFRSPRTTDAVADLVLGLPDFTSKGDCGRADLPPPLPAAGLCYPKAIAVDAAGNVFISDLYFHRILAYHSPLTTDLVPDRVFGKRGSFTSAEFSCNGRGPREDLFCFPDGVAVGSRGELYVAEQPYGRVLRYEASLTGDDRPDLVLGQVDLVHSTTNLVDGRGFSSPTAIAVDRISSPNHLYLLDFANNRVLGWRDAAAFAAGVPADLVFGQPDLFTNGCNTGGLSASSLCFRFFSEGGGLAVDDAGNLYLADTENHRVLEYDSPFSNDTTADLVFGQGGSFTSAACNLGGPSAASLCEPMGLALDPRGNLYVADRANHRVLLYRQPLRKDTIADRVFGKNNDFRDGPRRTCQHGADFLCLPRDLEMDGSGNLYVADTGHDRVLRYDTPLTGDGRPDKVFGQNGSFTSRGCRSRGPDRLCRPIGLAVSPSGALYVADITDGPRVVRYPAPRERRQGVRTIARGPFEIRDLTLDADGHLYVVDLFGNRVLVYFSP